MLSLCNHIFKCILLQSTAKKKTTREKRFLSPPLPVYDAYFPNIIYISRQFLVKMTYIFIKEFESFWDYSGDYNLIILTEYFVMEKGLLTSFFFI